MITGLPELPPDAVGADVAGVYYTREQYEAFRADPAEQLLRCECGCGKWAPGGRLEDAHPEDYRYERG